LSNGGVITVAAMLVIATGIMQTGIVTRATRRLLSTVTSARQALRRLLVPAGVASALMNSTPPVAMLTLRPGNSSRPETCPHARCCCRSRT
jgi:hypothetical protein